MEKTLDKAKLDGVVGKIAHEFTSLRPNEKKYVLERLLLPTEAKSDRPQTS